MHSSNDLTAGATALLHVAVSDPARSGWEGVGDGRVTSLDLW
jgi:hypothetical protein